MSKKEQQNKAQLTALDLKAAQPGNPRQSLRGREIPDPKPAAMSLHFTQPATTKDLVTRLLEEQRVKRMLLEAWNVEESDEEAEDFGDEDFDGLTPTQWEKEAEALPIQEVRKRVIAYLQDSQPSKLQIIMGKFRHLFRTDDLKRVALAAARGRKVAVAPLKPKEEPKPE